ncbi:hypothetical protein BAU15_11340 [Enterococcus sp. JM4C]|uniref:NAD(P)H-binding protein n=1 Tax=Candidatus Enterococcus huntleyi TaxID=1857217 RepID=UPI00137998B1|nr:NAD(P)H-binding protein [Enterococcus sp. JM4C]KAF1297336.1 hypothetical protein BAU15_11340 [Enterococcus sp. JM4C]
MRVIIFGGSGFVGQAIIKAIQKASLAAVSEPYEIISVSRHGKPEGTALSDIGVTWVAADVFQPTTWANYVRSGDIVIDAIGIFYQHKKRDVTYKKMHYEAAIVIANICEEQDASQLFYISAAHGIPFFKEYLVWKRHAEEKLLAMQTPVVILRPSLLYSRRHQYYLANAILLAKKLPIIGTFFRKMNPLQVEKFASNVVENIEQTSQVQR